MLDVAGGCACDEAGRRLVDGSRSVASSVTPDCSRGQECDNGDNDDTKAGATAASPVTVELPGRVRAGAVVDASDAGATLG